MNEDSLLLIGAGVLAFVLFKKSKTAVPVSSVYHPPVSNPYYAQPVYQYPGQQQGVLLPLIQQLFGPGTAAAVLPKPAKPVSVPVSTNSPAPASSSTNNPADDSFLGVYDPYNTSPSGSADLGVTLDDGSTVDYNYY